MPFQPTVCCPERNYRDLMEMTLHDLDFKPDAVIRGHDVVFFEQKKRCSVFEKKSGEEICLSPRWTVAETVS